MQAVTLRRWLKRALPMVIAAGVAAYMSASFVSDPQKRYLTVNPSVSQRFVSVGSEETLGDLCYRLRGVHGVTGVSYRDYSAADRSATVTVFFNPRETSVRQLRIFMLHTKILWQQEMNV
jgi:hypothetical protein